MLRRALFVSTLILAGTFGFANSAKAQSAVSQPVTFSGNVPAGCTLGYTAATDSGSLGVSGDNSTLSSSIGTGEAAQIDIQCTGRTITVSAPAKTGGDVGTTANGDIETKTAMLTMSDSTVINSGAAGSAAANGVATINMVAQDTTAALVAGNYEFTVTVTATP